MAIPSRSALKADWLSSNLPCIIPSMIQNLIRSVNKCQWYSDTIIPAFDKYVSCAIQRASYIFRYYWKYVISLAKTTTFCHEIFSCLQKFILFNNGIFSKLDLSQLTTTIFLHLQPLYLLQAACTFLTNILHEKFLSNHAFLFRYWLRRFNKPGGTSNSKVCYYNVLFNPPRPPKKGFQFLLFDIKKKV